MPNFRNVEIQSSKLLSALSLVAGYGLVNAGNEEANEVDIRVVTKKRTMDVLLKFYFIFIFIFFNKFPSHWHSQAIPSLRFKQAAEHYVGFIALTIDIQLVFLIMIVSSTTRENLSSFFNVYETGYYDLWQMMKMENLMMTSVTIPQ